MSTTNPQESAPMRDSFETFVYRTSQAALVVAPVLILLPPRKADLYTLLLSGTFVFSAGHLYNQRRLNNSAGRGAFVMPARAQELQTQLAREKDHDRHRRLLEEPGSATEGKKGRSLLEEKAKSIWMGGESEGWKERRLKEEQERLANGEGYGDMIIDQIWDVWNWTDKKVEDLKEKDKDVLKQQQRANEFPKIGKD